MAGMFDNAYVFNQPIGTWNTAAVTKHELFVLRSPSIQPACWLVGCLGSCEYEGHVLQGRVLQPTSWLMGYISAVTSMESMFQDAHAFNQPIGS